MLFTAILTNGPGSQAYLEIPDLRIGDRGQSLIYSHCIYCTNEIPTFIAGSSSGMMTTSMKVCLNCAPGPESVIRTSEPRTMLLLFVLFWAVLLYRVTILRGVE